MASQRQLCQQRLPEKWTEHKSRDVYLCLHASKNFIVPVFTSAFASKCFVFAPEGVSVFVYAGNLFCFRC